LALVGLDPNHDSQVHPVDCAFYWDRGLCEFILAQTLRSKREIEPAIESYAAAMDDFSRAAEFQIESDGLKFDRAHCLLGFGLAYAESNRPDQAVGYYRDSLSLVTELSDSHPKVERFRSLQTQVGYSLAANRMVQKDFEAFQPLIETNIEQKKQLIDDFPDARAKYLSYLGDSYNLKFFGLMKAGESSNDELMEVLIQARTSFEQSLQINPDWNRPKMALARVISNIGFEYGKRNDMAMAAASFRDAIDRLRTLVKEQPNWAEASGQYYSSAASLIFVLQQTKDFDEAIKVVETLVEDCPDHPRAFSIRVGKAKLFADAERFEEAYEYLESVGSEHARSWNDYAKAAEMAIKISGGGRLASDEDSESGDTDGASSETENSDGDNSNAATFGGDEFRSLAIQILKDAIEAYPQSKDELIDWLKSNPQLESLVEKLD
jgi:tetratricopeptide (TPR) repeat protein